MLKSAIVILVALSSAVLLAKAQQPPCAFREDVNQTVKLGLVKTPMVDFQTVRVELPGNLADIATCTATKAEKVFVRYGSDPSVGWKEREFKVVNYSPQDDEEPKVVEITGHPCQTIEIRLSFRRSHVMLSESLQFGPATSVSAVNVDDLGSDSVKISWSNLDQDCASGFLIGSSDGHNNVVDNYEPTFERRGLFGCTKYSMQVTPKFNNEFGKPREVGFETFPDETFFGVKTDSNGIEYSHDELFECKSIQYVTYGMSVITESAETKEVTLKAKAFFFELEKGIQRFEAVDISQELTVLGILGSCKSYEFNITAKVEGQRNLSTIVYLAKSLVAQTDNSGKLIFSDDNQCLRDGRANFVDEEDYLGYTDEDNEIDDQVPDATSSTTTRTTTTTEAFKPNEDIYDEYYTDDESSIYSITNTPSASIATDTTTIIAVANEGFDTSSAISSGTPDETQVTERSTIIEEEEDDHHAAGDHEDSTHEGSSVGIVEETTTAHRLEPDSLLPNESEIKPEASRDREVEAPTSTISKAGHDDQTGATTAVIVGLMFLACIIAFLAVVAYRRWQQKQATTKPEWEAAELGKADTFRALEDMDQQEYFLPENTPDSGITSEPMEK